MAITILEARTEEQPYFYEFKKYEMIGPHPTMAQVKHDPFPNAQMEDVVRREIIGRQLKFFAKMEFDDVIEATNIRPGRALNYGPHTFAVESSEIRFETGQGEQATKAIVDVVGSQFLTEIDPMKTLAKLREMLAFSNPS